MANHMIERHIQKVRHLDHPVEPLVDLAFLVDISGRHKSTPFKCSRSVPVSGEKRFRSTVGMSQFKFSWGEVWGGPMNAKEIRADEDGEAPKAANEVVRTGPAGRDAKAARLEAARQRARKQEIARRTEEIKSRGW